MPNFDRARALKGADGIREAAEKRGGTGGEFTPFCPEIRWGDDGEEKYILILTPIADALGFNIHEWVKVGTYENRQGETKPKFEWFMSRKDPAIGEDYDELSDRLDNQAKLRTFGVAVELEPVVESGRGGRQQVVGFEVATTTYNRKGDDDETVEVTQPVIGVVMQAAQNFWGWLTTFNETQADIETTPFQVIRRGKDANTTYDFFPMDKPVDFSNLLEYIDGVTYLARDEEFDGLVAEASSKDEDLDAAMVLAEGLLNKRLNELADKERYDRLVKPITHLEQKFPKKGAKGGKKAEEPKQRVQRRSRREATAPVEEAPATETPAAETPAESAPAESAPAASEKQSTRGDRFAALRARAEAQKA